MKVSKFLLSTVTTAAVVGAIGLSYAQNSNDGTSATPPNISKSADSTNTNPSSMSNTATSGSSTMSNSPSSSTASNSSPALDERAPRADRN
jgi:hypothetical protein